MSLAFGILGNISRIKAIPQPNYLPTFISILFKEPTVIVERYGYINSPIELLNLPKGISYSWSRAFQYPHYKYILRPLYKQLRIYNIPIYISIPLVFYTADILFHQILQNVISIYYSKTELKWKDVFKLNYKKALKWTLNSVPVVLYHLYK